MNHSLWLFHYDNQVLYLHCRSGHIHELSDTNFPALQFPATITGFDGKVYPRNLFLPHHKLCPQIYWCGDFRIQRSQCSGTFSGTTWTHLCSGWVGMNDEWEWCHISTFLHNNFIGIGTNELFVVIYSQSWLSLSRYSISHQFCTLSLGTCKVRNANPCWVHFT